MPSRATITRSTVLRDPAARARVTDAMDRGATVDEITDELHAAGHAVSRSAVGRATQTLQSVLQSKRHADQVVDLLRPAEGASDATEGRLELIRTLLVTAASNMLDPDGVSITASAKELRAISAALLDVERTGQLVDQRLAEAATRERTRAGTRGEQAARRAGLSPDIAAAIRAAVEGQPDRTPA